MEKNLSTKELSIKLGQKSISGHLKKVIAKLLEDKLIEWTIPDKPKSSRQKYRLTQKGRLFYKLVNKEG